MGLIRAWLRFPVQQITVDLLGLALDLEARYAWSYWDSAVVAASLLAGCAELMTEDLQDGQPASRTKIANPFSVA